MTELYYGPPDADNYCAYQYRGAFTAIPGTPRPVRRCPNHVDFYIKIPDGRGDDWRKAWASCIEHLHDVIWQMQEAYGGDRGYDGDYLLRANLAD